MKSLFYFIFLGCFPFVATGNDLVWNGYLKEGELVLFHIASSTDGRSSKWLSVGQSFGGHKVVNFNQQQEKLIVQLSNGETRELSLHGGQTRQALSPMDLLIEGETETSFRKLVSDLVIGVESALDIGPDQKLYITPFYHKDNELVFKLRKSPVAGATAFIIKSGDTALLRYGNEDVAVRPKAKKAQRSN